MSTVLTRTVDFLANRLDRRGFLGKTAVVGSAVVAAPLEFGLRPRSAYAAVCNCNGSTCGCGALCCDGYTEFCCTLNGANACPPGTITAGWWKVDGSQFCGGAARYYLDCNAQCGTCSCGSNGVCSGSCSGTPCGCAQGSCNNRKAGCTRFRYGQCNQHVRCVGPIVCRVVTCAAPWQFDPACGTSSRTDNATRYHDRPCLNAPFGNLDSAVGTNGAGIRVRGWAVSNLDYTAARIRVLVDGAIVGHQVANQPRPDVARVYPAFGPNHGFDLEVAAANGSRLVCVYAVDQRNGQTHLIGLQKVNVQSIDGRIDSVTDLGGGRVRVRGWATDPGKPNRPATVRLRVDGQVAQQFDTNVPRPDVVRARPGSYANSGFSVVLTTTPGARSICGDVVTSDGRAHQFRCATTNLLGDPLGYLDGATDLGGGQVRVWGWAIDPPRGTDPAEVAIRVDGVEVARVSANRPRPDVASLHPGYGPNHGYEAVVAVSPGQHEICVDAVNGADVTPLRCRSVTVAG